MQEPIDLLIVNRNMYVFHEILPGLLEINLATIFVTYIIQTAFSTIGIA